MWKGPPRVTTVPPGALAAETIAQEFVTRVLQASQADDAEWPSHDVVLNGDPVVISILDHVRTNPLVHDISWHRMHVWWSHERWLPNGSDDRHDTAVRRALLDHIDIPAKNVHPMPGPEPGWTIDEAASAYQAELSRRWWEPRIPSVMLLEVGVDGRVAGLHPGQRGLPRHGLLVSPTTDEDGVPGLTVTRRIVAGFRDAWLVALGERLQPVAERLAEYLHLQAKRGCTHDRTPADQARYEELARAPALDVTHHLTRWYVDTDAQGDSRFDLLSLILGRPFATPPRDAATVS